MFLITGTVRAQDEVDTDEPTPTEVPDEGEVEEVIEGRWRHLMQYQYVLIPATIFGW